MLQNAIVLLQNVTVITNCDDFITKCNSYYKMRRLWQIATVHTDFFQITCFKESKKMAVENSLGIMIKFYDNDVFQLSHGMKSICRSKLH